MNLSHLVLKGLTERSEVERLADHHPDRFGLAITAEKEVGLPRSPIPLHDLDHIIERVCLFHFIVSI